MNEPSVSMSVSNSFIIQRNMGQPEHGWHSDETRVLVRLDDYLDGNRYHIKSFVAGAKRDEDLQRRIQSESDEFGDIIQADRC